MCMCVMLLCTPCLHSFAVCSEISGGLDGFSLNTNTHMVIVAPLVQAAFMTYYHAYKLVSNFSVHLARSVYLPYWEFKVACILSCV